MPKKSAPKPRVAEQPVLQGVMAAIGAVAILSAIGLLLHDALRPAAAPDLSARIVEVQPAGQAYVARVRVDNAGGDTASDVALEGQLGDQSASATLAYVPGRGHAIAFLRFDADPHAATVAVKGWSAP